MKTPYQELFYILPLNFVPHSSFCTQFNLLKISFMKTTILLNSWPFTCNREKRL